MLPTTWEILMATALLTFCMHCATIPTSIAVLLDNELELSNTSDSLSEPINSLAPAKPDLNATRVSSNGTAGQNDLSWSRFVTIGIQRTKTLFPSTLPISIKTYSCDGHDYSHWHYLDCYTIGFSGLNPTNSASIEGRWDQIKADIPYWNVPVQSTSGRSSPPIVPWPPFMALDDVENLARSMGHTHRYHTVTLEGVQGSSNSFFYNFYSREVEPWHFSFHDTMVDTVANGTEEVSDV